MSQATSEKISTLKKKIEPTLISTLMAEHPRLGVNTTIPTDVVVLIAKMVHKDVSKNQSMNFICLFTKLTPKSHSSTWN
jgi:hypothetical protein